VVKQRLSRDDDLDQHAKDQVKTNREDLTGISLVEDLRTSVWVSGIIPVRDSRDPIGGRRSL
jgi:hypothetical protein